MLFSGFYASSDSIPVWTRWIEYSSPFRYALEALIYNEYDGRGFVPDPITTFGYTFGYWLSVLLLFAVGIGFLIVAYSLLLIRAKRINN